MKVVHSSHLSVMHRHMQDGTDIERFEEGTLTFIASAGDLRRIRGIKANAHAVVIDHVRQTADHGTHSDPAIIVEEGTFTFLQIFLCGSDAAERISRVALILDDGSLVMVDAVRHDPPEDEGLTSSVTWTQAGWFAEANGVSVTPIWQHSRFGVEKETVGGTVSGRARLKVPALFSDRLGLCLTTDDLFGGIEHKHLLHGEAGQASGRWVYAGGNMLAPRARRLPAFKSAVVRLDGEDVPPLEAFAGFDELQIFCHPRYAEFALRDYSSIGASVSVMSFSDNEEDQPDLLLVDPRFGYHNPSSRPISMLLFSDQNDPEYPDRFRAAAALFRRLPENVPVLESAWFAESGIEPTRGERHYGIGYSYSSADFPAAMNDLTRRIVLPGRQLCGICEKSSNCMDMLATPWAKTVQPGKDHCGIFEGLDLLYSDAD